MSRKGKFSLTPSTQDAYEVLSIQPKPPVSMGEKRASTITAPPTSPPASTNGPAGTDDDRRDYKVIGGASGGQNTSILDRTYRNTRKSSVETVRFTMGMNYG
jgi:hypothetical protein